MKYVKVQEEKIPALGLGTWQLKGEECEEAVENALNTGYRHIDTAQAYDNEERVGNGIQKSDIDREDVWLTTKIWTSNFKHDDVISSFQDSLRKLQTEYVDLLLIHWPNGEAPFIETLQAMEELVDQGKVRNIGISNFEPEQMEEAQQAVDSKLLTNQVEYHPFLDQTEVLEKCREMNMMLTAYSPLARGDVMNDQTLKEIGESYGKTPVQVALRWIVQQENVAAIPKSTSREHIEANFDIFDFTLNPDEMEQISELTGNDRKVDPDSAPWD